MSGKGASGGAKVVPLPKPAPKPKAEGGARERGGKGSQKAVDGGSKDRGSKSSKGGGKGKALHTIMPAHCEDRSVAPPKSPTRQSVLTAAFHGRTMTAKLTSKKAMISRGKEGGRRKRRSQRKRKTTARRRKQRRTQSAKSS
jgi:hypothetical protein